MTNYYTNSKMICIDSIENLKEKITFLATINRLKLMIAFGALSFYAVLYVQIMDGESIVP